MKAVIYL